jgi:DNA-binding CsgD family transcriptional regulator
VRTELGISQSTLDAHLASARRKLDVRKTIQAVLRFCEQTDAVRTENDTYRAGVAISADYSEAQIFLLDRLAECYTFIRSWNVFREHLSGFGVSVVNLGVIADPKGEADDRNWTLKLSLSDELVGLYRDAGGPSSDPIANSMHPAIRVASFDFEAIAGNGFAHLAPMQNFARAFMDHKLTRMLSISSVDQATRAPYGFYLMCADLGDREFKNDVEAHTPELVQTMELFWDHIQRRALLSDTPKLSIRERDSLQMVMRGFTVSEIAERIHVSQRSAEKFLAVTRNKLGARNNAQAVYRAMVFRALD